MFYSQFVLAKKGPLGKIWLAAHMEKKVPKVQILTTNIPESVESIENPTVPMALRVSGHLLLGVVRIFSRKVTYLFTDCSEAMVKIKDAFRSGAVELAPGASTRRFDDITNPEAFDEMDLDAELPTQAMNFSRLIDDDLLEGISIPDGALGEMDVADADGHLQIAEPGLDTSFGAPDEPQGFGHNDDFDVFFEGQADPEPVAPPPSKRRRGAAAEEGASREGAAGPAQLPQEEQEAEEEEEEEEERFRTVDEEMLPEREQLRSDYDSSLMGGIGDDPSSISMMPPPPGSEYEHGGSAFAEREELPIPDDMPNPGFTGFGDEFEPVQPVWSEPDRAEAKQQQRGSSKGKRKHTMVIDEELQLGTEIMKQQLSDTSEIVRTLVDDSSSQAAGRAPAPADPFLLPPCLPLVASELLEMACLLRNKAEPAAKRPRPTKSSLPARDAASAPDVEPPPAQLPEEPEIEQWRSHAEQPEEPMLDQEPAMDAPLADGDRSTFTALGDRPSYESFGGGVDEPSFASEAFMRAAPSEPDDRPEAPPCFEASHGLPAVDANAVAENSSLGSQSLGEGHHDPSSWSARTQQVYAMLGEAFKESAGMGLSYDAMIAQTNSAMKRRVVAGCFQELLFLTTHGLTDLAQNRAYGDIIVTKTEQFDAIAAG